ncbi:MAG: MerR family transcriptional regulator [Gammaproteobacteria bacterium]|nr:MerR family transcriptional regulator [Gammaproteobacteria bacterium]MAY02880.1 MerR family transcriptional regulator [Gammaproteobacteria bacterium]
MRVNNIAKALGVSGDTVRYYTRIGYIRPHKNANNGYKEYSKKDATRLKFILSARQLGFSVTDIGNIIQEAEKGKVACPLVRQLIDQRLQETEKRFLETVELFERMKAAVMDWQDKPDKEPTGDMICHLIENFSYTNTK